MKKTILIVSVLALITSSCGNKKDKTTFDLTTFPAEWRSLIDNNNGEWEALDSPFTVLKINGNELSEHDLVRVDETGYEQTDRFSEIVEVRQMGDTVVFNLKDKTYDGGEFVYKFLWINEEKGVGEWIFAGERGSEAYIVREREAEKFAEKQPVKKLQYYFVYNDYALSFYEDGTRYDTSLPNEKDGTYKKLPDGLSFGGATWMFFDDFGYLHEGWQIFNFHKVNSRMQITNFEENAEKIAKSDIQNISETCLIIFPFDMSPPEDENSPEAEAYFTIADDWVYYASETQSKYEAKGIKRAHFPNGEKQYLSFMLAGGEKIVIDTKKEQNGKSVSALLYKKGQIPITISLTGESDYGNKIIEEYLR